MWPKPPTRAKSASAADARAEARRHHSGRPWVIDPATIEAAWAVENRCQLNHWDAWMVAAAQHPGCRTLLTDDLQHDRRIDPLRIVNRFVLGPDALDSPVWQWPQGALPAR